MHVTRGQGDTVVREVRDKQRSRLGIRCCHSFDGRGALGQDSCRAKEMVQRRVGVNLGHWWNGFRSTYNNSMQADLDPASASSFKLKASRPFGTGPDVAKSKWRLQQGHWNVPASVCMKPRLCCCSYWREEALRYVPRCNMTPTWTSSKVGCVALHGAGGWVQDRQDDCLGRGRQ